MIPTPPPRIVIQRTSTRRWGPCAWRAWVDADLIRWQGEFGTWSWTRAGAERKGRWLMRKYLRSLPGEEIEITP